MCSPLVTGRRIMILVVTVALEGPERHRTMVVGF